MTSSEPLYIVILLLEGLIDDWKVFRGQDEAQRYFHDKVGFTYMDDRVNDSDYAGSIIQTVVVE